MSVKYSFISTLITCVFLLGLLTSSMNNRFERYYHPSVIGHQICNWLPGEFNINAYEYFKGYNQLSDTSLIKEMIEKHNSLFGIDTFEVAQFNYFSDILSNCELGIPTTIKTRVKSYNIKFKEGNRVFITEMYFDDSNYVKEYFARLENHAIVSRNLPRKDYGSRCNESKGNGFLYVTENKKHIYLIGTEANFIFKDGDSKIVEDTLHLKNATTIYKYLSSQN